MAKKSTFYLENQNSETNFISSTLKVEEIKVENESGLRILIFQVKSGFCGHFDF